MRPSRTLNGDFSGKNGLATKLLLEVAYFQGEKIKIKNEPHSPSRGDSLSEAYSRSFLAQQLLKEVNKKPKREI